MSNEALDVLRARVHQDPELARRLRQIAPEQFAGEVARIAAGLGIGVTADGVQQAVAHGRQAWTLRWIP